MTQDKTQIDGLTVAECNAIVAEENLVVDVQFLLQEILASRELSRADLARLTGVSRARLSQIMSSEANPTLRTLARIFTALDCRLQVSADKRCTVDVPNQFLDDVWAMLEEPASKKRIGMSSKRAEAMLAFALECSHVAEDTYVANDNMAPPLAPNFAVVG